jgi:hypothetical protein
LGALNDQIFCPEGLELGCIRPSLCGGVDQGACSIEAAVMVDADFRNDETALS